MRTTTSIGAHGAPYGTQSLVWMDRSDTPQLILICSLLMGIAALNPTYPSFQTFVEIRVNSWLKSLFPWIPAFAGMTKALREFVLIRG